jgi:hypothetical protein
MEVRFVASDLRRLDALKMEALSVPVFEDERPLGAGAGRLAHVRLVSPSRGACAARRQGGAGRRPAASLTLPLGVKRAVSTRRYAAAWARMLRPDPGGAPGPVGPQRRPHRPGARDGDVHRIAQRHPGATRSPGRNPDAPSDGRSSENAAAPARSWARRMECGAHRVAGSRGCARMGRCAAWGPSGRSAWPGAARLRRVASEPARGGAAARYEVASFDGRWRWDGGGDRSSPSSASGGRSPRFTATYSCVAR